MDFEAMKVRIREYWKIYIALLIAVLPIILTNIFPDKMEKVLFIAIIAFGILACFFLFGVTETEGLMFSCVESNVRFIEERIEDFETSDEFDEEDIKCLRADDLFELREALDIEERRFKYAKETLDFTEKHLAKIKHDIEGGRGQRRLDIGAHLYFVALTLICWSTHDYHYSLSFLKKIFRH